MSEASPAYDAPPLGKEARRFTKPGRTREGQAAKRFRLDLIAHVGGTPTATQRAMIDQAAQLHLHLGVMDRRYAEAGAVMTWHDSRVYLAWANSLTRLLGQLGLKGAPRPQMTVQEKLAARAAAGGRP